LLAFLVHSVESFLQMPPPKKIFARQRVLAQWRGVDLSPLETARTVRARAAGDILPRVLSDLHMDDRRAEAEMVQAWNSLVDPNIVAHAQPAGVRKGTLFVNVDSNVWLSEIVRYRRKEILERLQHCFGRNVIQKISFRVG
jgi:predicted nucleic acid-binding Zn ribbon protein